MALSAQSHFYHDPIRAFVENLLSQAGFAHLPAMERVEAMAALMAEAERRVGLELTKAIDPHSLAYFRTLAARGASEDELAAFFDIRVPDAESRVRRTLEAFGEECLRAAANLRVGL